MRKAILVTASFYLITAATSCSPDSDTTKKDAPESAPRQLPAVAGPSPEIVVHQFLTWYETKRGLLSSLPVVPASLTGDDDTTDVYKVDFRVAKQFLTILESSNSLSKQYLANQYKFIQQADSVMQAARQLIGPPEDLNYDRVTFSQDPDADLKKLLRTKPLVTIKGDTAQVYFPQSLKPEDAREGLELEFLLVQQEGRWVIDSIRPDFTG
jgi:hypothetical protein